MAAAFPMRSVLNFGSAHINARMRFETDGLDVLRQTASKRRTAAGSYPVNGVSLSDADSTFLHLSQRGGQTGSPAAAFIRS